MTTAVPPTPDSAAAAESAPPAPTRHKNRHRGALLGAMFLMATSAVGPGFIVQTTNFTVQLGAAFDKVDVVTLAVTNIGSDFVINASTAPYLGFDNLVFNKLDTDKIFVAGVTNVAEAQVLIDQANLLAQYIPSGDTLLIGNNTQVLLAGLLPSQLSVNDFIFS